MFEIQDNLHIRIILTFRLFLFKNEGWGIILCAVGVDIERDE